MAEKPPAYNPSMYQQTPYPAENYPANAYSPLPGTHPQPPPPGFYPPPPPPYQQQPPQPYPQQPQQYPQLPQQYPQQQPQATTVIGVKPAGSSTTFVTRQPGYGAVGGTGVVVEAVPTEAVLMVGGCPTCRVGVLSDEFTLAGVCCALVFFPLGILCCLGMMERRCNVCRAVWPR